MQAFTTKPSLDNKHPMIPTAWTKTFQALLSVCLLTLFSSSAFSFATYEGCGGCHGQFDGDDYVSKKDGTRWNTDLMSGHGDFVDSCDACHKSGGRGD